jgi:hypothetical protein
MNPGPSAPRADTPRPWGRLAGFGLGFWLLLAALGRLDHSASVPLVGDKLAHFRRHADDYDTVFVGSSLVYWQVSPGAYDGELRARGLSARSFNLGVSGMAPPESYYVVERVLAAEPERLRYVYLELNSYRLQARRSGSTRFTHWHTPAHTVDVLRAITRRDSSWRWKATQSVQHVEAWLERAFLMGQGRALAASVGLGWLGPTPDPAVLGPDGDGWLSADDQEDGRAGPSGLLGPDRLEFEEQVESLRGSAGRERSESEVELESLLAILERIRAAGATPILLASPRLEARGALVARVRARTDVEVMDFHDPGRNPELFEAETRADLRHLNREGSLRYSRAIAARFAERGL